MERVGLLNEEGASESLFPAPSKLVLFIFGGITSLAAFSFFIWACVKTAFLSKGYEVGTLVFVLEFFAGLTSIYASIRRSRPMTVAAVGSIVLGTAATTVGYGAGNNPIFSDPAYIVPMYSWIGVGIVLALAAATSAAYDGGERSRRLEMYPIIRTNMVLSACIIIASAIFFAWAQYNTIVGNHGLDSAGSADGGDNVFDVGIVCFFVTAIAGVTGLYASGDRTSFFAILHVVLTAVAVLCVIASYGAGFWYVLGSSESDESEDSRRRNHVRSLAIGSGIWLLSAAIALVVAVLSCRRIREGSKEAESRYPF